MFDAEGPDSNVPDDLQNILAHVEDTRSSYGVRLVGALIGLNKSSASDRRSFVEQLEHAFKAPAKADLFYDFLSVPSI